VNTRELLVQGLERSSLGRRALEEYRWRWYARDRARAVYDDARPIDLSRVELIRAAPIERLSDPAWIEHDLLPALGFNDELLEEFPTELLPRTGEGLLHWQYPNQFSKYLVELSRHRIESYLEVGVRHGGTFVVTTEYLKRFRPLRLALGNDLLPMPGLEPYARSEPEVELLRGSSHGPRFWLTARRRGPFDLVLIDGDHTEEGCRRDFELLRDQARLIAFHDIASEVVEGVPTVWCEIKERYADRYDFVEFTDQYGDVHERTRNQYLGLGLVMPKGTATAEPGA
jgi:hypothetical protein